MKDSSVSPTGLLSPTRQRVLLDALIARFQTCQGERQSLVRQHAAQRDQEEQQLVAERNTVMAECRRQRYATLSQWDAAEEKVYAAYESETLRLRNEVHRLASLYRRKRSEGIEAIEHKVESRRAAVQHQYDSHKHEPGEQSKREFEKIKQALVPIGKDMEWTCELTVRRLDGLPNVPPAQSPEEVVPFERPETIRQTIDSIGQLTRRSNELVQELQTGASVRFVDSFYLPAGVAAAVVIWIVAVLLMQPEAFWTFMLSGVAVAGVIGISLFAALLLPLRRKTRRMYPLIYRTAQAAEEVAELGRQISTDQAKQSSEELITRRNQHFEQAEHWRDEQLEQLEQNLSSEERSARQALNDQLDQLANDFESGYGSLHSEMHQKADVVAAEITAHLAQTDAKLHKKREHNAKKRHTELQHVTDRLRAGVRGGLDRIAMLNKFSKQRFPEWATVAGAIHTSEPNLDFVPVGELAIGDLLYRTIAAESQAIDADLDPVGAMFHPDDIPDAMTIGMHRRLHSGLLVRAASGHMNQAIELVQSVLWRMLTGTAGGRTRMTLIDPIGRGQSFTSFMSLADFDPAIVGHRVWTTENQIEARLGEVAQHAEDVLQSSLRDRFERIEDYNVLAGSMAEPYHAVAAVGFPEGLTRGAYKHVKALIESGLRCGVFVLMACDESMPWPSDLPQPKDARLLELHLDAEGVWSLQRDGLQSLPFRPMANVPVDDRPAIVESIGKAANLAAKVEVPLGSLLPTEGGDDRSDHGLEITIGSQGGHRTLALDLGEGVKQHVLIAGKTGSGKSTLLHALITSGAYHYRPDQLQFYLLDFKKGVEFKAYADSEMPHARVIGIESEREFGRSVLQRLDAELQQRGELFRAHSTQELSEFRRVSGQAMPRIMLVVDEFQELFVRDDKVAAECSMLLDRLVRQGRSFGIHIVLSSQSLAGAYSLPRATLGQMAVRIAMQCSESDAALILSDDNTAARLISRPGEAIYNDAGGLIEGNQPFQVAWLASDEHQSLLRTIADRDAMFAEELPPPVIFEGNRPSRWTPALAGAAIDNDVDRREELQSLLGEAVEIGAPVSLRLNRNAGRNVLVIPPTDARAGLLSSIVSGFTKSDPRLEVVYFNGNRPNESQPMSDWFAAAGISTKEVKPRDATEEMNRLVELIKERGDEAVDVPPILVVIDPLDRFRDFRHDDAFNFSLDAATGPMSGGQAFREMLKDGPPAHVYAILVCGSTEIVTRWLPRQSQHDVELRVLGRLNAADSSLLIDSPIASELSNATMLLYDEPAGKLSKFRQLDLPDANDVQQWISK
ncbi:FtsK/SpoIIIE domain-containing protein [Roseiconus lacunae]|uniref:FtsK/SpoIIIE domain-containing protein n=1 Tax=Roseiconus lacunae TaxID=2605694 RepID=UPI001E318A9E|nr:FtsK/SpoIIIE domain-containing protein [Roseiconus lacunae]MCD0462187.1 AAA family ATPase [Roseiconus lacunae]